MRPLSREGTATLIACFLRRPLATNGLFYSSLTCNLQSTGALQEDEALSLYLLAVFAARLKALLVGAPLLPTLRGLPPRFFFWFIL